MNRIYSAIIPHAGNNYRPHIIRHHFVIVLALLLLGFQSFVNYSDTGAVKVLGYATNVTQSDLLSLTNQQRAGDNLSSFTLSSKLSNAAQAKANHMIANNYWSHIAPDGTTPWYFIDATGYSYQRAGENLAYGFTTSSGVINGWMNSPAHAANILDSRFSEVGFGIANGSNFQGDKNTVVVAMYALPTTLSGSPAQAESSTPSASSDQPAEEPETAPKQEETEKTPKKEAEESESNTASVNESQSDSQYLLAQLDNASQIEVSSRAATQAGSETITMFEALVSGQAHWSLYIIMGALTLLAIVYALRHLTAIFQMIVHGEHYIEGHPTLEASIIYALLWLILVSSYGVIL